MKIIRNSLIAILVLTLVADVAVAAGATDHEIRIGWQPSGNFEFFLAWDEGMFERAGLKPTFVKFLAGAPMLAALKSGDIDVAWGGMPPFLYGVAEDLDISVFFWSLLANLSLVVRPDSGINSIQDLKGKTIATVMGSSAHYWIMKILADNGITSVKLLNVGSVASLTPAFAQGDITAAVIWEPWGVKLTSLGGKRIGPYSGYSKYTQTGIYFGRKKWMNEHPETVKKFLGVLDEALGILHKDPARAARAHFKYTGIEVEQVLEILRLRVYFYPNAMRDALDGHPLALKPTAGQRYSGHVEALAEMAEFLYKNGNLPVLVTRDRLQAANSPQFLEDYFREHRR